MQISIKAARTNASLTQREAAEKLGISRYTLMRFERKPEQIPYHLAGEISRIYGVPKDNLFFLQNSPL